MGPLQEMLEQIDWSGHGDDWKTIIEDQDLTSADSGQRELIKLVDGRARYAERTIFSGLDFSVRDYQHTLISGPNGAGKSTLLGLVTGDHQDCYTNELYLFGNRRGSGESIWQIKKDMGIVSPALHREHYVPGNCLQIVASGFFDSIGLYRKPTQRQIDQARAWLGVIGLEAVQKTPFRRVGFAEQRLVLIARALIKLPKLLVLDEPTQGLDDANRARLLDFLEVIADRRVSTIVYVSHRRDEFRSFFLQHIDFEQLGSGHS
jgi:molybdate transport system ATP-binding protein